MNQQTQYKLSNLAYKVLTNVSKSSFKTKFILIFHTLFLLTLVVKIATQKSCAKSPLCTTSKNYVNNYVLIPDNLKIIYILLLFSEIFSLIFAVFYVKICGKYAQIQKHNTLTKAITILSSVLYICQQIFIYPGLYYSYWISSEISLIYGLLSGIIICFGYYFLNGKVSQSSLYKQFTLFIVPLISVPRNPYTQSIVIVISLYLFIKSNNKFNRLLYIPIFTTLLSNLWGQYVGQPLHLDVSKTSVYLGILVCLAMTQVLLFSKKLRFCSQKQDLFLQILQNTSNIQQNQLLHSNFRNQQLLHWFSLISHESIKLSQIFNQKVQQKLTFSLSISSLNQICQQILQKLTQLNESSIMLKLISIEFMILKNDKIFKILLYINKNSIQFNKMNWQQKIYYINILNKLKNNYGYINSKGQLQISNIIAINQYIEEFQVNLKKLITLQIEFWEITAGNTINELEIYNKLDKINRLRKNLQKLNQKLSLYPSSNALKLLFKKLQNNWIQYDDENFNRQQQVNTLSQKIWQNSTDTASHEQIDFKIVQQSKFMILSGNKIQKISVCLAQQLKIQQSFQQIEWEQIFGEQISQYLQDNIQQYILKKKPVYFYLPIYKKQRLFVSAKGSLLWYPSIGKQTKFFIKFQTMDNKSFVIYDDDKKRVQFYNSKFLNSLNISQIKINKQLKKQDITFQRLFRTSFEQIFPQKLCLMNQKPLQREKSYVQLTMNLKGLNLNEKQSFAKIQMRIYDWIYVNQKRLAILQIRNIESKSYGNVLKSCKDVTNSNLLDIQQQNPLVKVYKNEKFFCPIPNSYVPKIAEKVAQLSEKYRFRSYMWFIIIGVILLTYLISQNVSNYMLFDNRKWLIEKLQNQIKDGTQLYVLIYKMYQMAFKRYQIMAYPDNGLKNRGSPAAIFQQDYKSQQQFYLNEFIQKYIYNVRSQPNKNIAYHLTFDNFDIDTDTQKTTLMDFADNFKRNIQTDEYDFILKNYLSFRNLTLNYQHSFNYQDQIQQKYNSSQFIQYFSIIVFFIFTALMLYISIRKYRNTNKILQIYLNIQNEQIDNKIKFLNEEYKSSFNCLNQKIKTIQKQQTNKTSNNLSRQSFSSSAMSNQHSVTSLLFLQIFKGKQHQQSKSLLSVTKKQRKIRKMQKINIKSIKFSQFKLFSNVLYFIVIFLICMGILLVEINNLNTQKSKVLGLFEFQQLLQKGLLGINRLASDSYIVPIYQHKYNKSIEIPTDSTLNIDSKFQQKKEFNKVNQIQGKVQNLLSNLCTYPFQSTVQNQNSNVIDLSILPCQAYQGGILTRGFSETYIHMLDFAQQIKKLKLIEFESSKCTQGNCPPYYTFNYILTKLNNAIQLTLITFQQIHTQLFEQAQYSEFNCLLIKLLISAILIILHTIFIYYEKQNSSRIIELFKIFPKQTINKIKITSWLQKNTILKRLHYL